MTREPEPTEGLVEIDEKELPAIMQGNWCLSGLIAVADKYRRKQQVTSNQAWEKFFDEATDEISLHWKVHLKYEVAAARQDERERMRNSVHSYDQNSTGLMDNIKRGKFKDGRLVFLPDEARGVTR